MLGTRPMDTISLSHSSFFAEPSAAVYSTVTSFLPFFTDWILMPSSMSSPCALVKILQASAAMDSSAAPRKAGSASMIRTLDPSRRHTLPSSRPITPAPITPSLGGIASKDNAPSLSHTRTLSTGRSGRCRAFEPVATMTCLAETVSLPLAPSTSTCQPSAPLPASLPRPCSQATLFFLNRPAMPEVILATMFSFRSRSVARSSFTPVAVIPWALNFSVTRS